MTKLTIGENECWYEHKRLPVHRPGPQTATQQSSRMADDFECMRFKTMNKWNFEPSKARHFNAGAHLCLIHARRAIGTWEILQFRQTVRALTSAGSKP